MSVAVASKCQRERSEKEVEREKHCFLSCYTLLKSKYQEKNFKGHEPVLQINTVP